MGCRTADLPAAEAARPIIEKQTSPALAYSSTTPQTQKLNLMLILNCDIAERRCLSWDLLELHFLLPRTVLEPSIRLANGRYKSLADASPYTYIELL